MRRADMRRIGMPSIRVLVAPVQTDWLSRRSGDLLLSGSPYCLMSMA